MFQRTHVPPSPVQVDALYDDQSYEDLGSREDKEICLPEDFHGGVRQYCSERKAMFVALVLFFVLPILPCRVWLHDHTWEQVCVGCFLGGLEGVAWFYIVKHYVVPRLPPPGQFWCGFIADNWHGSRLKEKNELRESLLAFDSLDDFQAPKGNIATQQMNYAHSSM